MKKSNVVLLAPTVFIISIFLTSFVLRSCTCGCGIEDPDKPYDELSEAGKLLKGNHPMEIVPGTNSYFQTLETGQIRMFVNIKGKSLFVSFRPGDLVFVESEGDPYMKFSWTAGLVDDKLSTTINYRVQEVEIHISEEKRVGVINTGIEERGDKESGEDEKSDYVESLIEGTNTFEE